MPMCFSARAAVTVCAVLCLGGLAARPVAQQPPPIGVAPVTVTAGPYVFDTAEQHHLRVVVAARGLLHPYGVALLPGGDALVTERGKTLRLVRGVGGPAPRLETAPVASDAFMAEVEDLPVQEREN